jgi:anti-sigma-K factor RskA
MKKFCKVHRDDWERYALGRLNEEQQAEMSAHLQIGCQDCSRLFMEAQSVVAALAKLPEPVEPSPQIEARLAEPLRQGDASNPAEAFPQERIAYTETPRRNFWTVAAWASAALFFVLFLLSERAYLKVQRNGMRAEELLADLGAAPRPPRAIPAVPGTSNPAGGPDVQDLQATIDQLRHSLDAANAQIPESEREAARLQTDLKTTNLQLADLQSSLKDSEMRRVKAEADASAIHLQLAKVQDDARRATLLSATNRQMVRLLESTSLHQLSLKPVNPLAGEANARVVWDNDRGLMLLAHDLPELPDKRVFQLWILRKGSPSIVSAGVVQMESEGQGTVYVPPGEDLNDMAGVVVTDEPVAGSTSPHGSRFLLGNL